MTNLTELLIRKLEKRDIVSDVEKAILEEAVARVRTFSPGEDLVKDGDRPWESILILAGFTARYKNLANGARQITAVHVPGDFVDLHGFLLKRMDHGIVALTPCEIAAVPHDVLSRITESQPHLSRLLWLSTIIDGSIHRQWIVRFAQRSAAGQLAHLVCELFLRLQSVGLAEQDRFDLPLTPRQLAQTLSLPEAECASARDELARGFVRWSGTTVVIEDWQGLSGLAEFDPTYLNLELEPR